MRTSWVPALLLPLPEDCGADCGGAAWAGGGEGGAEAAEAAAGGGAALGAGSPDETCPAHARLSVHIG